MADDYDFGNEVHRLFDGDQLSSLVGAMTLEQFKGYLIPVLKDESELSTRQIENADYEDLYDSYK